MNGVVAAVLEEFNAASLGLRSIVRFVESFMKCAIGSNVEQLRIFGAGGPNRPLGLLCYRRLLMRLHINVDHVATLRNARGTPYPDPIEAARVCLEAGAHGITAHLREDRRHIRDADVERLRASLRSTFNLEMAATDEMVAIACKTLPDVVTLVPERREERTTEGGLEVARAGPSLRAQIEKMHAADIKVSLFIAPDAAQIEASRALGVEQIELHTGEYAHAAGDAAAEARELARLREGAARGRELGLEIAAGHGLTTKNLPALVAIPEIIELNIGHAVVADAVFMGLAGAVRAMLAAIGRGRAAP